MSEIGVAQNIASASSNREAGAAAQIERDTVAQTVREAVLQVLSLQIPASAIIDGTNLFDLGADSMSIVELFFQLEERFALKFDETQLSAEIFQRFAALTDFVVEQLNCRTP